MSLVEKKNDDGKNTPPLLPPPPLPPPPLCGSFLNGIFSREGGRGKRAFFPERAGERGLLERERTREIQSYRRHCKNCSLLFFPFLQEERWSGVKKKIKRGEREKKLALASFSLSLTLHQKKSKQLLYSSSRWRPFSPPAQRSPRRRAPWRPPRLLPPSPSAPPRRGASR